MKAFHDWYFSIGWILVSLVGFFVGLNVSSRGLAVWAVFVLAIGGFALLGA